jgi:hypothetical protein
VQVQAEIVPSEYSLPDEVITRVIDCLQHFISPLSLPGSEQYADLVGADWSGWLFGRSLYVAEIFSLIQRVPGVKHVLDVKLNTRLVIPQNEALAPGEASEVEEKPLVPLEDKVLRVAQDMLLCSLDHHITVVELK